MKKSVRAVKAVFLWLWLVALPIFRIAFAADLSSSGDTVIAPVRGLDATALVYNASGKPVSYGLIFWDRFLLTVIKGPDSQDKKYQFTRQVLEDYRVQPVNTTGEVKPVQLIKLRYQQTGGDAIVVAELGEAIGQLTPVRLAYELPLANFSQWFTESSGTAVSPLVDIDENQLLELPLAFHDNSYNVLPGFITAEHDGSGLVSPEELLLYFLPGTLCLGTDPASHQLLLLGYKTDRVVYQHDTPEGERKLLIPFLPFTTINHLLATTAGISQSQSSRWVAVSHEQVSALALTVNDVLDEFGQDGLNPVNGYLCQANCEIGTAPENQAYCQVPSGQFFQFLSLEGRLEEWQQGSDDNESVAPDPVTGQVQEPDCLSPPVICFQFKGKNSEFGTLTEKGCLSASGEESASDYFIALVMSGPGGTLDPEQPTLPSVDSSNNSTSGPGALPGPEVEPGSHSGRSIVTGVVIMVSIPTGVIATFIGLGTAKRCLKKCKSRPDTRPRLLEESDDSDDRPAPSLLTAQAQAGLELFEMSGGACNMAPVRVRNSNELEMIKVERQLTDWGAGSMHQVMAGSVRHTTGTSATARVEVDEDNRDHSGEMSSEEQSENVPLLSAQHSEEPEEGFFFTSPEQRRRQEQYQNWLKENNIQKIKIEQDD